MSDTDGTFGSGLSFTDGGMAGAAMAGGPSADVTPAPSVAPPPQPSAPSLFGTPDPSQPQQPQGQPSFGSGLKAWMPPKYDAPDPQASALDQSASLLDQRIKRASDIARNPLAQFFDPEGVQKARDAVPAMTEQLQQIQKQKAQQVEIQKLGKNYGIDDIPQGADRETATNLITDELHSRYLAGDPLAVQGLQQLGRTDLVQAGGEQALSAAVATNQRYRDAVSKLANMRNPGEYSAAYKEIEQQTADGTHMPHELASVPRTFDEFQKKKQLISNQLTTQQMQLDSLKARMQQLGGVMPIQKQVDKDGNATGLHAAIASQLRDNNGNAMGGVEPVTVGGIYNGNRLPSGSSDINGAGTKWGLMSNEEIKTVGERIKPEAQTITRAAGINKLNDIAAVKDFGTNSWLLGHGIDQFVEISRNGVGGKGSATPGTIQIMENLRGHLQNFGDKVQKEWRQVESWVDDGKKGPAPYMSPETLGALKSAIGVLKDGSDKEISGVAGGTAEYVGRHGGKLDDLGAEPGIQDALRERWAKGNQEFKQDIASRPAVVMGGQRIVFDRDGVKPPQALTPGGFEATQPQPPGGGRPPVAPAPQAGPPSVTPGATPGGAAPPAAPISGQPPAGGTPGPAGGGSPSAPAQPTPVTIAGQQVTAALPSGASPDYLVKTQRIETRNEKDPWRAGNDRSSAGGAFQFINSTWAADKPPGAPDKARDATPQQQAEAAATRATKNAGVLTKAGIPVNDTNLYIAHNLGEGAGPKLLTADPNADARTVVGEAAAKNNPLFFKGKPTVAKVLERYDAEMNPPDDGPGPKPFSPTALAAAGARQDRKDGLMTRISRMLSQGVPGDGAAKAKAVADVGNAAVEHAPAIASTIGAAGGSLAGPAGTVAGGAAGGGAGQAFKDYMQGREQNPREIGKQAVLGGVLGVASEARPVLAAAGRVGGSGAVEGADTALQGGENSDVLNAAVKGGAYALGGEALGRFVSSGGATAFKALSRYTEKSQAELSAQAGKLHEARQVLATEQPKMPGEAGGPNPKYEAAKKTADDATQAIKDHGQNPDDMVHAYEQAKAGVSAGEALTMRKANGEKREVSSAYDAQRQEFKEAGVGAVKPNQAVPDGPLSTIRTADNPTGKVPEAFRPDAEHAEMLVKAPAKNMGEKWQQLQDAGSELIKKRISFLANNDKPSADAMNEIFQGVRNQQKALATYVFGKERGGEVIAHLENLDKRYAKVMNATAGMSYEKMKSIVQSGNTPARRDLEANFKEFAKDDPSAIRAFNAMKAGAKGRMGEEAKLMIPVIAGEFAANAGGIPTVGLISAAIGGHRMYALLKEYMNAKILGRDVTFRDFAVKAMKDYQHGPMGAAGSAAQRAVVMR